MEAAQIANMAQNAEHQRVRLQEEERRFLVQLQSSRDLQIQRIEADRSLQEHLKQIDRWPLQVMAVNILRDSASTNGEALNLILKLSSQEIEQPSTVVKTTRSVLLSAADSAIASAERLYADRLNIFNELHLPTTLNGRSLSSTLFGLLSCTPTALVEARVLGPMKFSLAISLWGWELDSDTRILDISRIDLDLSEAWSGLNPEDRDGIRGAREVTVRQLSLSLAAVISQLTDGFHILRRPHNPPALHLASILSESQSELQVLDLEQLASDYAGLNEGIAKSAPALAADTTARMALSAYEAGHSDFAQKLLERALVTYRAGLTAPIPAQRDEFVKLVMETKVGSRLSFIQEALQRIEGVQATPAKQSPRLNLHQISKIGIDGIRAPKQRNG